MVNPVAIMSPRTGIVALQRHGAAAIDHVVAEQVAQHVVEIGVDEGVADADFAGEAADQVHVEPVALAGDEIGVADAEMADLAAGLDLLEVGSPGQRRAGTTIITIPAKQPRRRV